jgi:hypothetical protein
MLVSPQQVNDRFNEVRNQIAVFKRANAEMQHVIKQNKHNISSSHEIDTSQET